MNEIKDIAHKLYLANKCPNGNLIMFQALKEYIERKGAKANFTVIMET